jgi:hypothetical protein
MLDKIKQLMFKTYNSEEQKGLFITTFDAEKKELLSQGVLTTDKPLRELLDSLYASLVEANLQNIMYICIDVVAEVIAINDPTELFSKNPVEFGFCLVDMDDAKSGVVLPNTFGIQDAKSALYYVKKKYGLDGKVEAFVFRTERIIVSK